MQQHIIHGLRLGQTNMVVREEGSQLSAEQHQRMIASTWNDHNINLQPAVAPPALKVDMDDDENVTSRIKQRL